jgi:LPS-assembly protein
MCWLLLSGFQISFAEVKSPEAYITGGADTPWEITAKKLTYREAEGVYEAEGDVLISKDGQVLRAEKATYNVKTGLAAVSGGVRLESGGDVFTGEEGIFDLKRQTGKIREGVLFLQKNHYYIRGKEMEKIGEDTYLISHCEVTTCDGVKPAWGITASKVKVTIEGYGTVRDAAFRVRGWPLLYVPYLVFPAKIERQTGLLAPRVGYSERNGADVELPFFWAIGPQTDATFYQRFLEKRGYMQGIEWRYLSGESSKGIFLADMLSDRREEKNLQDADQVELSPYERDNSFRYRLRGRADQDLPLEVQARLDADLLSDQDYLREFKEGLYGLSVRPDLEEESGRPVEDKYSPTRRSALRIHRHFEDISLQGLASYHQRPEDPPDDDTAQPLAGLNAGFLPQRLGDFPAYFSFGSDYDYVWRETGEKGHRVSVAPELSFPLWLGRYFEFEPSVKYAWTEQWFEDERRNNAQQSRRAYEMGVRLGSNLERVYELGWGGARRVKHRIWPELSYKYRDHQDMDTDSPWFEPVDDEGDVNALQLSVENFLDARLENRQGAVRYRQWMRFKVEQAYDIDEARREVNAGAESEPFLPLSASLTLTPHREIDLRGSARWDHYESDIVSASLSGRMAVGRSGGRKDTFEFDYTYQDDRQRSLNLYMDVNLVHGFSVGGSLQRDLEVSQNISTSGWVDYRRQCWGVRVGAEREDEDTRFMLVFNLLGLGEIEAF